MMPFFARAEGRACCEGSATRIGDAPRSNSGTVGGSAARGRRGAAFQLPMSSSRCRPDELAGFQVSATTASLVCRARNNCLQCRRRFAFSRRQLSARTRSPCLKARKSCGRRRFCRAATACRAPCRSAQDFSRGSVHRDHAAAERAAFVVGAAARLLFRRKYGNVDAAIVVGRRAGDGRGGVSVRPGCSRGSCRYWRRARRRSRPLADTRSTEPDLPTSMPERTAFGVVVAQKVQPVARIIPTFSTICLNG